MTYPSRYRMLMKASDGPIRGMGYPELGGHDTNGGLTWHDCRRAGWRGRRIRTRCRTAWIAARRRLAQTWRGLGASPRATGDSACGQLGRRKIQVLVNLIHEPLPQRP